MTSKKSNKAPITDPEEMEIYELSEKELKIILLKFNELQQHSLQNKIRKIIPEQNESKKKPLKQNKS